MTAGLATVSYIGAIILFILSLGGLSNPETARRGNVFGIVGMALAVLATVLGPRVTPAAVTRGPSTVASTAIVMPMMPNRLPRRAVSGLDSPPRLRMKRMVAPM